MYEIRREMQISIYVNVEPYVMPLTDVRNGVDGIESPVHCCSRGAVDEKRQVPLTLVANNQLFQLFGYHPSSAKQVQFVHTYTLYCVSWN